MHENRDISCTSWSTDQGRSAKAINRTADVNVQEKSDCAVVPVNQLNNGGQPSAEAGEGRAQTQENIVQSRMRPTQSGKRMSQGLSGVRKAARERKQERFTALLPQAQGTQATPLQTAAGAAFQLPWWAVEPARSREAGMCGCRRVRRCPIYM